MQIPKFLTIHVLEQNSFALQLRNCTQRFPMNQGCVLSISWVKRQRSRSRDRDTGRSGGGILMYISEHVSYKRRRDIEISGVETIWLELLVKNSKSIYVCSVYRPPSAPTSWANCLADEIRKASRCEDSEIILLGDINIDYTKDIPSFWKIALEEFNLSQMIMTPTRVTATSSSLIQIQILYCN